MCVDDLGYAYVCESYVVLDQCDDPPPSLCSLSVRMVVYTTPAPSLGTGVVLTQFVQMSEVCQNRTGCVFLEHLYVVC